MRTALLLAACTVLAAGCSTAPGPSGAQPARIASFTSPSCEARVNHAEGTPVLTLTSYAEVPPGRHVLGLFCKVNLGLMIGDAQTFQREVQVELAPGGRYRVEAGMEPNPCTMKLVDEATGKEVGRVY